MASIIFMRHGQAENNTRRFLAGRTEGVSLTEEGVQQARGAARLVREMGIGAVYTSGIERARRTAEIATEGSGISPVVDDRLVELDMGRFTGMTYADMQKRYGNVFLKFYREDPEIADSGIEPFSAVKERVTSMVGHVVGAHPDENVLLVTHMDPIKAMLSLTLGLSPDTLTRWVVANASLSVFGHGSGGPYARAVNIVDAQRYNQGW